MKIKKILASALAVTGAVGLLACGNDSVPLTDEPLTGGVLADFTQGEAETFFASHDWTNGGSFNVTWDKSCIAYSDGLARLSIADAPEGGECPYLGAELRSYQHFGYGDYTVRMKPLKEPGAVSAFFVYTGPTETNENGDPNPWDEIDIEFVGKDTTKVQFNYFANGKGGNEYKYDLGFDASKEFHDYGFRWAQDYIVWFVDGKPVYKVKASDKKPIPSTPGRILVNHWAAGSAASEWAGKYKGPSGKTADYVNIKTSAQPIGELPEKIDLTVPESGWVDIDTAGFDGWGNYDVDRTNGLNISHSAKFDANTYKCCGMPLAQSYDWVKFKIKNNIDTAASMRLDIKKEGEAKGAAVGVVSEHEGVTYNANDKAVNIELGANEQADIAVKTDGTLVNQIVLFLNSMAVTPESGNVTITELKGVENENPEPPAPPVEKDGELTFTSTEEYTVDKSGEPASEINVTYTDVTEGTYKNIQAHAAAFAEGKDTFSVTITNNGEAAVLARVDLIGTTKVGNTDVCNLSHTATGGTGGYTDTEWGGTSITVAPGETVTLVIKYDGAGERGAITRVQLYFDSSKYVPEGETAAKHSGNVTVGGFAFYKAAAAE